MHDDIKRFSLDGEITSDRFISAREALLNDVDSEMRDEGYVPVLDLIPQFTRQYNEESETFKFEISIYGVYVGEDKSWQVSGMTNGTLIEKYTPHKK